MPLVNRPTTNVPMATERGREAYVNGWPITQCPYPLGSCDSMLWIQAWMREDAEDEEAIHAYINQRGRLGI